jgi:hypothetical protein
MAFTITEGMAWAPRSARKVRGRTYASTLGWFAAASQHPAPDT